MGLAACQSQTADTDDAHTVTLDQLPPAVRATLVEVAGDGEIREIESELEHGQTVYAAEVMMQHAEYEVEIAADGRFLRKQLDDENDEGANEEND